MNARWGLNAFNEGLYLSDRSAFWDLYLHLFKKYPYDFVDSFLNQNVKIWQPGEFGIPLFMILLGLYIALRSKRPGYSAGITGVFVLWLTYIFAVNTGMYQMYPFSMLIPVILLPVFSRKTVSEEVLENADDGILDDDELMKEIEKLESEEKKSEAGKSDKKKDSEQKGTDKKDKENKKTEDKAADGKKESEQKDADKKDKENKKAEDKAADGEKEPEQKETDEKDKDSNKKTEDKDKVEKKESEDKDSEKAAEKKDNNSADSADSEKNGFEKSGDSENKKEEKDK